MNFKYAILLLFILFFYPNLYPCEYENKEKIDSSNSSSLLSQNSTCDSLVNFIGVDKNVKAKRIIDNPNFEPNCLSKFGISPLGLAAIRGNIKLVKYLLKKGADPNIMQKDGTTPLFGAIFIYEQSLEPNLSMKPSAQKYDYILKDEIFNLLIAHGGNIHRVDSAQTNLLMFACMYDRYGVIKELIQSGIDINAQNNLGSTALMYAVWRGNYSAVKFLSESGADTLFKDNEGKMALDIANESQNDKIISLFNENKCNGQLE